MFSLETYCVGSKQKAFFYLGWVPYAPSEVARFVAVALASYPDQPWWREAVRTDGTLLRAELRWVGTAAPYNP